MIGVKVTPFPGKVGEAREVIRKFSVRKIYRMSGFQKAVERDSMKHAPKGEASPRGTPPYTHGKISKKTGKPLPAFPQTIRFKVEEAGLQSRSVVGPTKRKENWAERIGKTHEFGLIHLFKFVERNRIGWREVIDVGEQKSQGIADLAISLTYAIEYLVGDRNALCIVA